MKITNIKAVYPKYKAIPPSWRTHLWQIVVKIETDIGIVGYGYGGGGKASRACGQTPEARRCYCGRAAALATRGGYRSVRAAA